MEHSFVYYFLTAGLQLLFYCYILYPVSFLEHITNTKHNITKTTLCKKKGTPFFILGSFKKENNTYITFQEEKNPKKERTFYLDKCLSCYIVVNKFVSSGGFHLFQRKKQLIKVSTPNNISISPVMCSNTKHLEHDIV